MYSGNGNVFIFRKRLYEFFKEYTDVINWTETFSPSEEYATFNIREVYSFSITYDEGVTYYYGFFCFTGREAGLEVGVTTNVRLFKQLNGLDFENLSLKDVLLVMNNEDLFNYIKQFMIGGN